MAFQVVRQRWVGHVPVLKSPRPYLFVATSTVVVDLAACDGDAEVVSKRTEVSGVAALALSKQRGIGSCSLAPRSDTELWNPML
jgi:hypothetical protein